MRLIIKKKTHFLFHSFSPGECSPFTEKCCLPVRYSVGKMGMYLLIHISAWFYISALCIFIMWYVLSTVKKNKLKGTSVSCHMHAERQSISLSLRQTASFRTSSLPPVAPHSLQGMGRGLWDPVCLTLLFPLKASLVSQKVPITCWVQSPCRHVSWLGKSVVRKRVLNLMCGSGNHHCVAD